MNPQEPENLQPIQPIIPQPVQIPAQNFVQNPVQPVVTSSVHKGMWTIVAIILLFVCAGGAFAAYHYDLFTSLTPTALPVETAMEPSVVVTDTMSASTTSTTATTVCDNYQCLIAAAAQCQPISATISYSGIPFPFNPDISTSGQTKYEIKKSSGVNNCTLVFSDPVTFFTLSEKGRQASLASGMTNAQITTQLQAMNDSMKSVAGTQTTCLSTASVIASYITDTKNGNEKSESRSDSTGQTTTFTTSSGQKLVCTTS